VAAGNSLVSDDNRSSSIARHARQSRANNVSAPILPNPIIPSCIALPPARSMLRE
jgi:hypothetical protein